VTGYSYGLGTNDDYVTIKYNTFGVEQWIRRYNRPDNIYDQANAITVDKSGNVYVTGPSATIKYNSSGVEQWIRGGANAITVDSSGNVYVAGVSDWHYKTTKYNSSGVEQWFRRYNGPGNDDDVVTALAVDDSGNVFVTGYSWGSGTCYDYATIKYNTNGDSLWCRRYNGPGNIDDLANAIAVDSSGNVFVTGYSWDSRTYYDYATIKYSSLGVEQWIRRYNAHGNSLDYATAIAVDRQSNVYVTGASWDSTTYNYATVEYNSLGVEQWAARYNGPGNSYDEATAIAVDDSGNVYVTGYSYGSGVGGYYDYATIKYNSLGVEQWVARYNGPGNDLDKATTIAIDSSGNVYVTGYSDGSGTSCDYATIKYNSSGVEQWIRRYNGTGNSDVANALAVDGSGNVYVTGNSYGLGTYSDYATVKYNTSGVEQWVARYNGPGNDYDNANDLAVDDSGNVYVTGPSATIKYNSSGVEQWIRGGANAITVDSSGNVYVAGSSMCLGTKLDYATIKYSTDGKEQWGVRYNGPENFNDQAKGIAIDAVGNVYVTGTSGGYYATIKYEQSIIPNSSIIDGLWSNSSIWSFGHVPLSSEDVVIQHSVVLNTLQPDSIQSLIIMANGILSVEPGVGILKVASVVQIEDSGKIAFESGAAGMIIYESFINRGMFECGTSSITFLGNTFLSTNKITFYDFISDRSACFAGDLTISNRLQLNDDLNIRLQDTVQIINPDTSAIEGKGLIPRGTVKRAIAQIPEAKYRFESLNSYLQFSGSGTIPQNVTITTYPDTNPTSFGNKWVVVPSHVDPVANVITADSVTGFSKWVFGIPRPREMEGEFELCDVNDTIPLIRRVYDIHAEGGSNFVASLSLRYEQAEVPEGVIEDSLKLFRIDSLVVGIKPDVREMPERFLLEQNYPNPLNPSTTIRYELPRESFVTLKVYNVLGQEVATLVNEKKEAGRYEVEFDGSMLTSGMYIYRMTAGDYRAVKKFLLLK